jgi:predicted O-methyltransferase YrrM
MSDIDRAIKTLQSHTPREIQRRGYHFQANDFYSPLNDLGFLEENRDLWVGDHGDPKDIDWNLAGQLATAREVAGYVDELRDVPHTASGAEYRWDNAFWNNADALVQYGLVRGRKPRRYLEIGSGWSSLLLQRAVERNGTPCQVTLVEPYPNREILSRLPRAWRHHECILQRVPAEAFLQLEAGDIAFYDGSHCSKVASDVNYFFFQVLPSLKAGVLVHFHDVFFPEQYPETWIFDRGQTWNEQYVLQAFLMNNRSYRILIANHFLFRRCGADLEQLYKGIQPPFGCSLWLEKL